MKYNSYFEFTTNNDNILIIIIISVIIFIHCLCLYVILRQPHPTKPSRGDGQQDHPLYQINDKGFQRDVDIKYKELYLQSEVSRTIHSIKSMIEVFDEDVTIVLIWFCVKGESISKTLIVCRFLMRRVSAIFLLQHISLVIALQAQQSTAKFIL